MRMKHKKKQFKTIISALLFVGLILFSLSAAATDALPVSEASPVSFAGAGTAADPYLIATYEDLVSLRDAVDAGTLYQGVSFAQTADIIFPDGVNWNPIGDLIQDFAFCGIYDGRGYVIGNIVCDDQFAGLFTWLKGEVKNLGIESGSFSGTTIGSITSHGTKSAAIVNCYNKASVTATGRGGGIADNFNGQIRFCWNLGQVTAANDTALVAGIASYGSANIQHSHTLYQPPVREATFTGTLDSVETVTADQLAQRLDAAQRQMCSEGNTFTTDNTVFLAAADNTLSFVRDYLPQAYEEAIAAAEAERQRFIYTTSRKYAFEGKGTQKDPFRIATYEDLALLRDCVDYGVTYRGYYFVQTADITFPEGVNWDPIGDLKKVYPFSGVYDGHGHTLNQIYCNHQYAGVFSWLCGEVRNLGIESGHFEGATIGSITSHGDQNAVIINCYNKADVVGYDRAGGLTDNFSGKIQYCWNFGNVTAKYTAAGITSYGGATTSIENTYAIERNLINISTYRGQITDSAVIEAEDIPGLIDKNNRQLASHPDQDFAPHRNTVFMQSDGEWVSFSRGNVPNSYVFEYLKRYCVVFALLIACIIFALVLVIAKPLKKLKAQDKPAAEKAKVASETKAALTPEEKKQQSTIKTKRVIAVVLTLSLLVGMYSLADSVLSREYAAGTLNLYHHKKSNPPADVLLLGSSTMATNIEVIDLWKDYGIAAQCLAGAGAWMPDNYYRLLEAEKTSTPKVVVLDVKPVIFDALYATEESRLNNVTGLDFSINKLKYVNAAVPMDQRIDYLLNLPLFHGRINELTSNDFLHTSWYGYEDKGNWSVFFYNLYQPKKLEDGSMISDYRNLGEKAEYYLIKIIEHCKANDIDILLIKTPDADRPRNQPFYNTVGLLAEEYDVPYINMNSMDDETGLLPTDFYYDDNHLNVIGARKCTKVLGDFLEENYDLPDRRGDAAYDSWVRYKAVKEALLISSLDTKPDYFAELERSDKKLYYIQYKHVGNTANEYLSVKKQLDDIGSVEWAFEDTDYTGLAEEMQLGNTKLTMKRTPSRLSVTVNDIHGSRTFQLNSTGLILLVYDEVLDEVSDTVSFTSERGYKIYRTHKVR